MAAKAEGLALDHQIEQALLGELALFVEAGNEHASLVGLQRARFDPQQGALGLLQGRLELAARSAQRVGDLRGDLAFERGQIAPAREAFAQLGVLRLGRAFRGTYPCQ